MPRITDAFVENDKLVLAFDDGSKVKIFDKGQQCCEYRYMHTDDDPVKLIGGEFLGVEEKEATPEDYEKSHENAEMVFVEVKTTVGFMTLVCYNDHNGYYGGFDVVVEREKSK